MITTSDEAPKCMCGWGGGRETILLIITNPGLTVSTLNGCIFHYLPRKSFSEWRRTRCLRGGWHKTSYHSLLHGGPWLLKHVSQASVTYLPQASASKHTHTYITFCSLSLRLMDICLSWWSYVCHKLHPPAKAELLSYCRSGKRQV